jgi:hypothetical protein
MKSDLKAAQLTADFDQTRNKMGETINAQKDLL